jgi:hypothetical protein
MIDTRRARAGSEGACRTSAKQRQPCASRRAARPTGCGRRSAEPVPSNRVSSASVRRPLPFASAPSGRVSLSGAILLHSASRGANRRRGRRLATAVVTCRAKSSSVAWASLTPSSRSGQAASNASYRPRRTPSRLPCFQAHPTEVAPPCAVGRLPPGQGLRRDRPRRLAGDRWAQPRRASADRPCRCGVGWGFRVRRGCRGMAEGRHASG